MDASSSTSASRRGRAPFPLACLAAVLAVICIEWAAPHVAGPHRNVLFRATEAKRESVGALPRGPGALVIADSRLFHVEPATIERGLGLDRPAVNVSEPFCGLEALEYNLAALLDECAEPPDLVISFFMPNMVAQPASQLFLRDHVEATGGAEWLPRLYSQVPPGRLLPLLWRDRNGPVLADYAQYLLTPPTLRERDALRRAMGFGPPVDEREEALWRDFQDRGAFALYTGQTFDRGEMIHLLDTMFGPYRPRTDPRPLHVFGRFLALAEARGVPVLLVPSPFSETLEVFYADRDVMPLYETRREQLLVDFPLLSATMPRHVYLPDAVFGDPAHVNRAGMDAHNEWLGSWLAENRGAVMRLVEEGRARRGVTNGAVPTR